MPVFNIRPSVEFFIYSRRWALLRLSALNCICMLVEFLEKTSQGRNNVVFYFILFYFLFLFFFPPFPFFLFDLSKALGKHI